MSLTLQKVYSRKFDVGISILQAYNVKFQNAIDIAKDFVNIFKKTNITSTLNSIERISSISLDIIKSPEFSNGIGELNQNFSHLVLALNIFVALVGIGLLISSIFGFLLCIQLSKISNRLLASGSYELQN